jgi:hypothetical protein
MSSAVRTYFPDVVVEEILRRVALGQSLSAICSEAGMPSRISWMRWCTDDEDLGWRYTRAQQKGLEVKFAAAVAARDQTPSAQSIAQER